jgi:Mg/Co/Ni transporter MgtE
MSLRRDLARDLAERHPDDAAAVLEAIDAAESAAFLAALPVDWAVRVLLRTTAHPAAAILAELGGMRASKLVEELPVDVAAGYLRRLAADVRDPILGELSGQRAASLRMLLRFREGSAGALMDPQVLALPRELSVREALERVRKSAEHARYNVYLVDRADRLAGVFNLRELLVAKPRQRLIEIMRSDVIRLAADADWRTVVDHPGWREVHALPVVDHAGTYLGAVRYRTLRRLEARRDAPPSAQGVTSQALGELFWTGISGVLDAMSGPPTERALAKREDGIGK